MYRSTPVAPSGCASCTTVQPFLRKLGFRKFQLLGPALGFSRSTYIRQYSPRFMGCATPFVAGNSNSSHAMWVKTQLSATFTTLGKKAICGGGVLSAHAGKEIPHTTRRKSD